MTWKPSKLTKLTILAVLTLSVIVTVSTMLYFYFGDISNKIRLKRVRKEGENKSLIDRRQEVLIFIGVISAPQLIFRRNALRRSWFTRCKKHNIPCWFFTDAQDMYGKRLPHYTYVSLAQEQYLHGDLVPAESPGGINFARRYLWMIEWADARYKFDFFLRVDDDYFICLDRLLLELPYRPKNKLYWGHVHCYPAGGVRVDEGFVIVSNDLVQEFLREKNNSLMCHPYGDQAMAMWINNIPGVIYFGDPRVHHEISAHDPVLQYYFDLCGSYLALHGSYPLEIEIFWNRHLSTPFTENYPIPKITYPCGNQDKNYNITNFLGMYHAKPIPCKESPTWQIAGFYRGREG